MRYRLSRTPQDMRDAPKDVTSCFRRTFDESRHPAARWRVVPRGLAIAAACIAMGASLPGHAAATEAQVGVAPRRDGAWSRASSQLRLPALRWAPPFGGTRQQPTLRWRSTG